MKKIVSMLIAIILTLFFVQMCAADDAHNEIMLYDDLFLVPIIYESEEDGFLDAPDYALHYFPVAAEMQLNGAYLWGSEEMPEGYAAAEESSGERMHMWTIQDAYGNNYIPLFISFEDMFGIFGNNIHVGVVSFEDAAGLVGSGVEVDVGNVEIETACAGIVLAPGVLNQIIPAADILAE